VVEAEQGQPAGGTRATEEEARGLEREVGGERRPHARAPRGADEADGDAVERNEDGDDALQQLRWEIWPCGLVLDTGAAALGGGGHRWIQQPARSPLLLCSTAAATLVDDHLSPLKFASPIYAQQPAAALAPSANVSLPGSMVSVPAASFLFFLVSRGWMAMDFFSLY